MKKSMLYTGIAYLAAGLLCLTLALSFCTVMGWFMPFARYAVIGLAALLVVQWFSIMAAFCWLNKKL